jgi:hypothetical protein
MFPLNIRPGLSGGLSGKEREKEAMKDKER